MTETDSVTDQVEIPVVPAGKTSFIGNLSINCKNGKYISAIEEMVWKF